MMPLVIGIDVAPGKASTVFDGDEKCFLNLSPTALGAYLASAKKKAVNRPVLLCWDAPLTGPQDPDINLLEKDERELPEKDHTKRPIERFFGTGEWKTPPGISVLGYGGCPHWTITRRLIGLPRVGPFDQGEGLPFELMTRDQPPTKAGAYVVEVHPALAMWLWLKGTSKWEKEKNWRYKGVGKKGVERSPDEVRKRLWSDLKSKFKAHLPKTVQERELLSDDELDALVAWLLGVLWRREDKCPQVFLIGNQQDGAFLLPSLY